MKLIKNPELDNVPDVEYPMQGGYVYILETERGIKIGRSKRIKKRINSIRNTSGKEILNIYISPACSNYCFIESEMHKIFKNEKIIGEWFDTKIENVVKALEKFDFREPVKIENNKEIKFISTNVMEYLKENEPIIYDFVKSNNYNIFYDENTKAIYISGFDNGEYFEMLFELFMRMKILENSV